MTKIDFDKIFGKLPQASERSERPKAQLWLNIGYSSGVKDEEGNDRFVSLPLGIPLDTQEHLPTTSRNIDYANFQAARNNLLDQIMEAGKALKPGESRLLNLEIQLRRINDEFINFST